MLKHTFQSAKPDGADTAKVRKTEWNQDHTLDGGADGRKLVRDSSQSFGGSWARPNTADWINRTGGALAVGDVVAISLANDNSVVANDVDASLRRYLVAMATPADTATGMFAESGPVDVVKADGAIARGDFVTKSTAAKAVKSSGVATADAQSPPAGALGIAITAAAGGFVSVEWFTSAAQAAPSGYTVGVMVRSMFPTHAAW